MKRSILLFLRWQFGAFCLLTGLFFAGTTAGFSQVGTTIRYEDPFGVVTLNYNGLVNGKHSYLGSDGTHAVWSGARWDLLYNNDTETLYYSNVVTATNPPHISVGAWQQGPNSSGYELTDLSGNGTTLVVPSSCTTPTAYGLTGGGTYCSGGTGVAIGLANSQTGVNYQLKIGGTNTGSAVAGTGAAISFGNQTAAGTYTVVATNTVGACTATMTGSVTVSVPTPVTKTWTGATSQDWNTASNWNPSGVPVSCDNVVIPQVQTPPTIYAGSVDRIGTTSITGALNIWGTLNHSGTMSISSGGISIASGGVLNNYSTINTTGTGAIHVTLLTGNNGNTSGGTFNNNAGGIYNLGGAANSIYATLNNNAGAAMNLTAVIAMTIYDSGVLNNAGTITNTNSEIYLENGGNINSTGTLTNNGIYDGVGSFNLTLFTNGSGGTIGYPGYIDCLSFNAGLTNNGNIEFEVAAGTACTNFDKITVNGTATLGGTYTASGSVSIGSEFVVLTATAISGTFTNTTYNMGGGKYANMYYTATTAKIVIESTPLAACTTPTAYSVTGGGTYCSGSTGVAISLANSQTGVNYQLKNGGTNTGSAVAGTGVAISFGNQTAAGTYTVVATNTVGTCTATMTGSASVTAASGPSMVYSVGGSGTFCEGSTLYLIGGSELGVEYQLYRDGSAQGSPVAGTGAGILFDYQTVAGNYTVVGTKTGTGCTLSMSGSAAVALYPTPTAYSVTGGGTYCDGGSSTPIGLSGSQTGFKYRLEIEGTLAGVDLVGTGAALSFGAQSDPGTYTVAAQHLVGGCVTAMSGSTYVSGIPLPIVFNVVGGGEYCTGGADVEIGLDGLESDVDYYVYLDGVNTNVTLAGGLLTNPFQTPGTYTIVASSTLTGCMVAMTGSATITPSAGSTETCNGVDDDCDGTVDEGVTIDFYPDNDGDYYGDGTGTPINACYEPTGYVADNTDCDDAQATAYPSALERCGNGIDDDCDGTTDEPYFVIDQPKFVKAVSCNGGSDGAARVNASVFATAQIGDYTFLWNNGSHFRTDTVPAGTYSVTVTHVASTCSQTQSGFVVAQPNPIVVNEVSASHKNAGPCNGASNGVAEVSATGGTGVLKYKWSNAAASTTRKITALAAGTYTCTVTDVRGCTGTKSVTITEPALLDITNVSQVALTGANADKYKATITAVGGTNPKSYSKDNVNWQASNVFSLLPPGQYTFWVKDVKNCKDSYPVYVGCPLLTFYRDADGDGFGNPSLTTQACTAPSGYVANNTDCNDANAAIKPGVLEVCSNTVDDNCNGQINEQFVLDPSFIIPVSCNNGSNGSIRVNSTIFAGTMDVEFNFVWSNGGTSRVITGLAANTYSVTVTQIATTCSGIRTETLANPALLTVAENVVFHKNVLCKGGGTGEALAQATGGTAGKTYLWSNGTAINSIAGVTAGIYTVTAKDVRNCTATTSVTITEPTTNVDVTNVAITPMIAPNLGKYKAVVTASGGTGTIKYSMDGTMYQPGNTFTLLPPGSYTFYGRDANACVDAYPVTISALGAEDRGKMENTTMELQLSPNPASDVLNVLLMDEMGSNEMGMGAREGHGTIIITDVLGRIVLRQKTAMKQGEPLQLNLEGWHSGHYCLQLCREKGEVAMKCFVVE